MQPTDCDETVRAQSGGGAYLAQREASSLVFSFREKACPTGLGEAPPLVQSLSQIAPRLGAQVLRVLEFDP
eukprot:11049870-Alexandrium_andersonii.AAC.1